MINLWHVLGLFSVLGNTFERCPRFLDDAHSVILRPVMRLRRILEAQECRHMHVGAISEVRIRT